MLCFRLFDLIALWVDVWYARFWFVGLVYFVGLLSWFVASGSVLVLICVCGEVALFVGCVVLWV